MSCAVLLFSEKGSEHEFQNWLGSLKTRDKMKSVTASYESFPRPSHEKNNFKWARVRNSFMIP